MLEKRRHRYLALLGIDQYTPRLKLTGACPSVLLGDDAFDLPAAGSQQDQQADKAIHPSHSSDCGTLMPATWSGDKRVGRAERPTISASDTMVSLSHHQKAGLADATSREPAPSQNKIQFVLSAWRIGDDCLVINSRQPGSALPTDRLLQNILLAIGCPLAQLPPAEILRWPIFANDQYAGDAEQARAMVRAFISARMTKAGGKPLQRIILMGESACHFALNNLVPDDSNDTFPTGHVNATSAFDRICGTQVKEPLWEVAIAITPNLDAMLQEPLQKALAWKVLKHFKPE